MFTEAGIAVLAPEVSEIVGCKNGFTQLKTDKSKDKRLVELLYLKNLLKLGPSGFSYFINPKGYVGKSASYELGIAQVSNVRYLFKETPTDHPIYFPKNSIWEPKNLINFIQKEGKLPPKIIPKNERKIYNLIQELVLPGSVVAVGAIIEHIKKKDILLVKTHKWGDRFSIIGGKVQRNETLADALKREIREESGLDAKIGDNIITFDEIKNSGYFESGVHRIFTDNVVYVNKRRIKLNYEAEDYIWVPPRKALEELDIEPNAQKTLEVYVERFCKAS